tara:strand:- start:685 stop:1323 length:639 start_codon:yes stop_codon:yes gene_type:complete
MKRRTEHLVEKRDGRREFLRATKLARSVHLALYEIGVDEDWRALELAGVVLEGLRQKRKSLQAAGGQSGSPQSVPQAGGAVVLTTTEIADSVQHLLVVTGQPNAAVAYGAVQAERARRRQAVGIAVATGRLGEAGQQDAAGKQGDAAKGDVAKSGTAGSDAVRTSLDAIPKAGRRSAKSSSANDSSANKPSAKSSLKPSDRVRGEGRIWGEG